MKKIIFVSAFVLVFFFSLFATLGKNNKLSDLDNVSGIAKAVASMSDKAATAVGVECERGDAVYESLWGTLTLTSLAITISSSSLVTAIISTVTV